MSRWDWGHYLLGILAGSSVVGMCWYAASHDAWGKVVLVFVLTCALIIGSEHPKVRKWLDRSSDSG